MRFEMRWLIVGAGVIGLVVNAVMVGFAFYGIGLYDACVSGGYLSSYEIAVPYHAGLPFACFLLFHSVAFGFFAVALGAIVFLRRRADGMPFGLRLSVALLACTSIAIAIAGCVLMGSVVTHMQSELEESKARLSGDYIENEWFSEMTLDDLQNCFVEDRGVDAEDVSESYLVYIGRDGCKECASFEEAVAPILSSDDVKESLPAYYTSEDRDGARSEEMYALLDDLGVDSVPSVLVVLNGKVLAKWDNPLADIGQIESYLKTGQLP